MEARMRLPFLVPLATLVLIPAAATQAQDWSAAQQEVWAFEQACWETETLDVVMACFHDDFLGWGLGSTVPTTKADRAPFFARFIETEDRVFTHLQPLSVTVRGDVAIVLYIATSINENKATGKETTVTERWTDIAIKEDNTWSWIADHGVEIDDDD